MLKLLSCAAVAGVFSASTGLATDASDAVIDAIKADVAADAYSAALAKADGLLTSPDLSDQDAINALGQKATVNAALGRYEEALAALGSALQLAPNDFWLLMRSCNLNLDAGFVAAARQDCALASRSLRHERNAESRAEMQQYLDVSQAKIALRKGNTTRGLSIVEKLDAHVEAQSLEFGSWHVDRLSAELLSRGGDNQAAIERLTKGIEAFEAALVSTDPDSRNRAQAEPAEERADMQFQLGLQLDQLGRVDEAMDNYEKAFELLPPADQKKRLPEQTEVIAYAICATALQLGDGPVAIERCGWLSRRVDENIIYTDRAVAYRNALGRAYEISGDLENALDSYEFALELDPENSLIRDSKQQVEDALARQ